MNHIAVSRYTANAHDISDSVEKKIIEAEEGIKQLQGAIKKALTEFERAHQIAAETCVKEDLIEAHGALSDDESTDRAYASNRQLPIS